MALPYQAQSAPDALWDLGRLVRLLDGRQATYLLSPTATLPAVWVLGATTPYIYLFDLLLSSDRQIGWTLYRVALNPGLTIRHIGGLSLAQGNQDATFEADVTTAPAVTSLYSGGYAAGGRMHDLLPRGIIRIPPGQYLVLATSVGPANCYATFRWVNMSD